MQKYIWHTPGTAYLLKGQREIREVVWLFVAYFSVLANRLSGSPVRLERLGSAPWVDKTLTLLAAANLQWEERRANCDQRANYPRTPPHPRATVLFASSSADAFSLCQFRNFSVLQSQNTKKSEFTYERSTNPWGKKTVDVNQWIRS